MKYPPIQTVAQEIVDAIKPLVRDRTINIMDTGGTIVASSDPARVGTFHQGAAEAAANRRAVYIQPEEVPAYPGAKEGINLPVVKNGELLGVVGIYGVPEEVEQAANLLGACVDLYLDQALATRRTRLRKDMLLGLVRRMLSGELLDREELMAAARELSLDLRLPVRAIHIAAGHDGFNRRSSLETLDRIHDTMRREGWVVEGRDVHAVLDDAVVVIKHVAAGFDAGQFARNVRAGLGRDLGAPVCVALGGRCDDWRQVAWSHHEARVLADMEEDACLNIDSWDGKALYMLKGCLRNGSADRYLDWLYQALINGFGAVEMERVMETIGSYCRAGCRCGVAAAEQGIHKNTMNYRVNKILALTGMEESDLFGREFFLRLLCLHHQRRRRG